jgi:glycosyltransferase involved in cell wall biosynthesis
MVEPLGHLLAALLPIAPSSSLLVLSHSDHHGIRERLATTNAPSDRWEIRQVAHEEVPRHLNEADVGLQFLEAGIGAASSSPTKIGEYWACGLPVVANPGAGDAAAIASSGRVGVLVTDFSSASFSMAAPAIVALLGEPGIRERCRRAAEEHYALESAIKDQIEVYDSVTARQQANR